jgi:hypothetical protein
MKCAQRRRRMKFEIAVGTGNIGIALLHPTDSRGHGERAPVGEVEFFNGIAAMSASGEGEGWALWVSRPWALVDEG